MRLSFDDGWRATEDPLHLIPRFAGTSVRTAPDADMRERDKFLVDTFGSQEWLGESPDVLRFAPAGR
ncbi:hypothetical protein OG936_22815 [Streptomyces sp. NBC_00846]|uniref:hypothetical protein n=1 Tax=Streptomyces sp. NBC_00846 TaxID=2975849 RepID=UPI00386EAB53|nr:hypothetical protein OG936_22815 [Streptomyces sp. NBC_00846]